MPKDLAVSQEGRIGWVDQKIAGMPAADRGKYMEKLFGKGSAAYVSKWMAGEVSPQDRAALDYAKTDQAAADEAARVESVRQTTEAIGEKTAGVTGPAKLNITEDEKLRALTRKIGADYLKWLQINNPMRYHIVKFFGWGDEAESQRAAEETYKQFMSQQELHEVFEHPMSPREEYEATKKGFKRATGGPSTVNIHYHNDTINQPRVGPDNRGGRYNQD
jgi:hypothetical protein